MDNSVKDIEKKCSLLLAVCKGLDTPLKEIYKRYSYTAFVNQLVKCLPSSISPEATSLYRCFFKTAITYIESSCNDDDKVLLSINKIAAVNLVGESGQQSVFTIMLDRADSSRRDDIQKKLFEKCKKNYKDLLKLSSFYDEALFSRVVSIVLDRFAERNGLYKKHDFLQGGELNKVLDFAIHSIEF